MASERPGTYSCTSGSAPSGSVSDASTPSSLSRRRTKRCRRWTRRPPRATNERRGLTTKGSGSVDANRRASSPVSGAFQRGTGNPARPDVARLATLSAASSNDCLLPPRIGTPPRRACCSHRTCPEASVQGTSRSTFSSRTTPSIAAANACGSEHSGTRTSRAVNRDAPERVPAGARIRQPARPSDLTTSSAGALWPSTTSAVRAARLARAASAMLSCGAAPRRQEGR